MVQSNQGIGFKCCNYLLRTRLKFHGRAYFSLGLFFSLFFWVCCLILNFNVVHGSHTILFNVCF
jgi:hypothetical protein